MVSAANGNTNEIEEESVSGTSANGYKAKEQIPLYISTSQRGLLGRKNLKNGFLSILTSLPSRARFMKIGSSGSLTSPSGKFRQIAQERDEVSRSVPSSTEGSQEGFSVPFVGKISWVSLKKKCREWIRDPMNMALLVWIICVAVSGAILFLVMTGMLDRALPKKTQRDAWFEMETR
ncbi:hypothetical protein MRB53_003860 [Persea americana]|uniref:Uncharacterized protein n=1 Tax=Persea americana TaxID=3435 RepID=A0ACC2N206_PERAE|nr:hypothetical protein MRB53_003860 [Persea americana]